MVEVIHGDCLDVLAGMPTESIDACCTDPPYGLGFMGKSWDHGVPGVPFWAAVLRVLKPGGYLLAFGGTRTQHRLVCAIEDAGFEVRDQIGWCYGSGFPKSHNLPNGLGTALKPAWEPICVARKPLIGTVAANVLRYGTGALNVDGCRVEASDAAELAANWDRATVKDMRGGKLIGGTNSGIENTSAGSPLGRWPANLVHDGSDEVLACFPETGISSGGNTGKKSSGIYGAYQGLGGGQAGFCDTGSAARFFQTCEFTEDERRLLYTAKASSSEREGGDHPTVKPVSLMRWLVRLVTPPGGTVLDPFAGSGTTGVACQCEGFDAVLIEREPKYVKIARRRLSAGPLFYEAAE